MINIPEYVASRRDAYQKIPTLLRIFIQLVSFIVAIAGLILVLTPPPLFDLGVLLLVFALSILSFQFDWAHRLLTYIDAKLRDKAFRKKLFPVLFGVFALLLISIFYLHIHI